MESESGTTWTPPVQPREWLTVWAPRGARREPICVCDGWAPLVTLLRELPGCHYYVARKGDSLAAVLKQDLGGEWHLTRFLEAPR